VSINCVILYYLKAEVSSVSHGHTDTTTSGSVSAVSQGQTADAPPVVSNDASKVPVKDFGPSLKFEEIQTKQFTKKYKIIHTDREYHLNYFDYENEVLS
jgi:hypothetical protein